MEEIKKVLNNSHRDRQRVGECFSGRIAVLYRCGLLLQTE